METEGSNLRGFGARASPTRLEGMETFCSKRDTQRALTSPTRLEGMETLLQTLPRRHPACLRPALRGWKRYGLKGWFPQVLCLRPALRGWKPI